MVDAKEMHRYIWLKKGIDKDEMIADLEKANSTPGVILMRRNI